nr:hypothetical protein [Acidobacteriota bacterium]
MQWAVSERRLIITPNPYLCRGSAVQYIVVLLLVDNGMKVLTTAFMVFILAFGCGKAEANAFDFQSGVGVVDVGSNGYICLTIPNANLAESSRVQIVSP